MRKFAVCALAVVIVGSLASCYIQARGQVPTVQAQVVAPPPVVVGSAQVVGTAQVVGPPHPTIVGTVVPPHPTVITGAQVLQQQCNPNAPEILNGIDDNCNGQIDEGFVGTGNLQITLGWNTPADLDLYVTDPTGTEISYSNTRSPSGGYLDRDARGACTDGQTGENIFWSGTPPPGHYAVQVKFYDGCNTPGPTTFVLSVAYDGQVVGAYQYTVSSPDDVVDVVSFDL